MSVDFGAEVQPGDWLLSCRHGYESEVCSQLQAAGGETSPVFSGLVRVNGTDEGAEWPVKLDVSYALQMFPAVSLVQRDSLNQLARAVVDHIAGPIDGVAEPWSLHVLVPGRLRGNPKPPMARRADLLERAVLDRLSKIRRRAMHHYKPECLTPSRLVQVLLWRADAAWVSFSAPRQTEVGGSWPSGWPAGLAPVADDPVAPASSYRKLEEAMACMGRWPVKGERAVDVGACPGGWTRVLLRYGATVDAVDRQPLAPHLMRDRKVHFHRADAFTWAPDGPVDWWVSDVVAYPDRIIDMAHRVSTVIRPELVVLQMKFRGEPEHGAVTTALTRLRDAGYGARARHFFNDKNEVTLMARWADGDSR